MGEVTRRVCRTALQKLQTWRRELLSLIHRPGTVFLTVLTYTFAFWLSLKEVRLAFLIMALLGLPKIVIFRETVMSYIYLVLLVMMFGFMWIDLLVIRYLKSRFGEALRKMCTKCLCRCLPQYLLNAKNTSGEPQVQDPKLLLPGVPQVQDPQDPGIPVSNQVASSPVQLARKNPPRTCKRATKY